MKRNGVKFSLRSIGTLPARITRRLPFLFALAANATWMGVSWMLPRLSAPLASYYYIRIEKP